MATATMASTVQRDFADDLADEWYEAMLEMQQVRNQKVYSPQLSMSPQPTGNGSPDRSRKAPRLFRNRGPRH